MRGCEGFCQENLRLKRFVIVALRIVSSLIIAFLILVCHQSGVPSIAPQRHPLASVQTSVAAANEAFQAIPEWAMVERGIQHYLILRQVELYDRPSDREARWQWILAEHRAGKFMPLLACWLTSLREFDRALLHLSGSLHRAIHAGDAPQELRCLLSEARHLIEGMRAELNFGCRVLENADSFVPTRTDHFDPDFAADLEQIQTIVELCEIHCQWTAR